MFSVGMKVEVVRDMADGWGPSAGTICQVVKMHPYNRRVFWINTLKADGTLGDGIFWTNETDVKILEEKKMTLGTMLKDIGRKEEEAKVEARRKEEEASARRLAKIRTERKTLINDIADEVINNIKDGKKPMYKLYATDLRSWLNTCRLHSEYACDNKDLYTDLVEWLKSEGLRLKVTEAWDGGGERDWLAITVEPLPGMEVEAD